MYNLRAVLGIVSGLIAFGLIVWFSADLILSLGGAPGKVSALTVISLMVLALIVSVNIGALVGSGRWIEESGTGNPYPLTVKRSLIIVGVAAAVFVLSIIPY